MIENSIILIGGGGHCSSCIEVINSKKHYFIKGIIDVQNNLGKFVSEYPIIGTDNDIENFIIEGHNRFLISLGQIKSSCPRRRLFETVNKLGGYFPIIIAQTAFISRFAKINDGTIIMHQAFVNTGAQIGTHCIINTGSIIEHGVIVGDFCHISTKAVLNGEVKVGNSCFIGSGAIVSQSCQISDNCIIGAGTVVIRDLDKPGTYIGNPARRIK